MKQLLSRFLNCISFRWLGKCPLTIDEPPFSLLTPTDSAEDIEPYRRAMDFALSNKHRNVWNIAVTGPYGSGKSSFLDTYFKNRAGVLRVSLALFLENEDLQKLDPGSHEFEHRLEVSILQQIFCARKDSRRWIVITVAVVALLIVSVFGVCQPDWLVRYVTPQVHNVVVEWARSFFWFSAALLFAVVVYTLILMMSLAKSIGIKRIEVNGAGVGGVGFEVPDSANPSLLNRNINSIINYFAKSKCNVVILEDIDRFDDIRIFTKLREVNSLLNNSPIVSNRKKPIRFIYALREDLFVDETKKTKFFDFVIPIIPRINASNSRTDLMEFFKECEGGEIPEGLEQMVKEVSSYISDTRLLKNICNEYYTYHEQIDGRTSEEELLGLVIFKNFFPREFSLMHQGRGLIRSLLEAKVDSQKEQMEELDAQIGILTKEINDIEGEKSEDIDRLQALYYVALMKRLDCNNPGVNINGDWVKAVDVIHIPNWFEHLQKGECRINNYGREIEWKKIEDAVDPNCTYAEHLNRINGRAAGRIEEARQEIQQLRAAREQVRRKTIVDLMSEGALTAKQVKELMPKDCSDRQDVELFLLLVKNGYLNENYHYNISIFREVAGVNSVEDYYFELGVTRGETADWDRVLKRPGAVIENLNLKNFATPAVLNFSVCSELLKDPETSKAKEFFRQIAGRGRVHYEFVDGYLKTLRSKEDEADFFDCLMSSNQNYITELVETSFGCEGWPREFVEKQIGLFVAWALRQGRVIAIKPCVRTFIEETARMPELLKDNGVNSAEEMSALAKMFALHFRRLDCKSAKETGFLDVVLVERAYAIVPEMIKDLLGARGVDVCGFETNNYSLICSDGQLIPYVDTEFKTYLDAIYVKLKEQQKDAADCVLKILNREDLTVEDLHRFVARQWRDSRVADVKQLKTAEALQFCIDEDWVLPSWSNAAEIWNRNKNEHTLFWKYVGRKEIYTRLGVPNSRNIPWEKDEWWAKEFAESDQLSDEAVMGLLSGMNRGVIEKYSGANATPNRIYKLFKAGRLCYSNQLFRSLKDHGNDSHIMFAALFAKEFCVEYEDGFVNANDVEKLLGSNQLNRRNVPLLLNTLCEMISGNSSLEEVAARLVNRDNCNDVDEQVLDAVLSSLTPVSLQCRVIQRIGGNSQEIRDRLIRMPEPYGKLGKFGHRPEIQNWEGLGEFLDFLTRAGVVSSYEDPKDGKIQVNTTRS